MSPNRFDRIEQTASQQIERGNFSGIEWLVLHDGKRWARGRAGWLDAPNKVEMPEKPLYRIFSMTKPIVSVAALMLMEQGKIRLFDPVAAYVPEFGEMELAAPDGARSAARNPVIIEHLMTHRSGLSYQFLPDCPVAALYRETDIDVPSKSLAQFAADIGNLPLAFEPGTQWRYSVATDVLARVVEVAAGKPLPQVLDELIFQPAGMRDTWFAVPESERHRMMAMFGKPDIDTILEFEPGPQKLTPSEIWKRDPVDNADFSRGGYGLKSSIDDYARFMPVLATGATSGGERLLARKTVEMMWTNRVPPGQLPLFIGPLLLPGYGYGLAGRVMIDLGRALGLTSPGEVGWAGAASTYFWIDPAENLSGIVMAQYLGSKVPLGDEIRRAVYQALE